MEIKKEDYNILLEELISKIKPEEIQPDEITIKMFMERTGFGESKLRRFLKKEILSGNLTMRQVWIGGARTNVYKKALR